MSRRRLITTVTSPAGSYDLVALADVKDELGITDSSSDTLLGKQISRMSLIAAGYCNRVFVQETVKDEFFPPDERTPWVFAGDTEPLQLSRFPAASITTVMEDGTSLTVDTDYRADLVPGQMIRVDSDGYPTNWQLLAIAVTYVAGYATIPADLQDAVIRMVKSRWYAKGRDTNIRQENIPGVREVQYWVATGTDAGALTPDVQDILDSYRVPVVG